MSMPSWIQSPLFAVFVTIISIFLLLSLLQTDAKLEETAGIRDSLREEVEELRDEVAHIQIETQIATSSATQEKVIRNELLLQKPGEYIVQLPSMESIDEARAKNLQSQNNGSTTSTDEKSKTKNLNPDNSAFQNWLIMFGIKPS